MPLTSTQTFYSRPQTMHTNTYRIGPFMSCPRSLAPTDSPHSLVSLLKRLKKCIAPDGGGATIASPRSAIYPFTSFTFSSREPPTPIPDLHIKLPHTFMTSSSKGGSDHYPSPTNTRLKTLSRNLAQAMVLQSSRSF